MNRHSDTSLPRVLAHACLAMLLALPLAAAESGRASGGVRQSPPPIRAPGGPASGERILMPGPVSPTSRDVPPPRPQPPLSVTHRGTRYVITDGQWYEQRGRDLVTVTPPAGVLVRELPEGHSMRWIGGVPYFYADGLYYVWRERPRRYEILQEPPAEESRSNPGRQTDRDESPSP